MAINLKRDPSPTLNFLQTILGKSKRKINRSLVPPAIKYVSQREMSVRVCLCIKWKENFIPNSLSYALCTCWLPCLKPWIIIFPAFEVIVVWNHKTLANRMLKCLNHMMIKVRYKTVNCRWNESFKNKEWIAMLVGGGKTFQIQDQ